MATAVHPAANLGDYESYLDSQITDKERRFLDEEASVRQLVELGFLKQNVISQAEFTAHKNAVAEQAATLSKTPKKLASTCLARSLKRGSQLLQVALPEELAAREHEVLQERLAVIIFIRAMTPRNHEVSGYIDFHHRLQQGGVMEAVFQGRAALLPTPQDLSFYSYQTRIQSQNSTSTLEVVADSARGLVFKDKRDGKTIDIDPEEGSKPDNAVNARIEIQDPDYLQAILFCHSVRHH